MHLSFPINEDVKRMMTFNCTAIINFLSVTDDDGPESFEETADCFDFTFTRFRQTQCALDSDRSGDGTANERANDFHVCQGGRHFQSDAGRNGWALID